MTWASYIWSGRACRGTGRGRRRRSPWRAACRRVGRLDRRGDRSGRAAGRTRRAAGSTRSSCRSPSIAVSQSRAAQRRGQPAQELERVVATLLADVPERRLDAWRLLVGQAARPDGVDQFGEWRVLHRRPVGRGAVRQSVAAPARAGVVGLDGPPDGYRWRRASKATSAFVSARVLGQDREDQLAGRVEPRLPGWMAVTLGRAVEHRRGPGRAGVAPGSWPRSAPGWRTGVCEGASRRDAPWNEETSSPDRFDVVARDRRIGGQDRQALDLRLCDEHPVKGIAVDTRRAPARKVCASSIGSNSNPWWCRRSGMYRSTESGMSIRPAPALIEISQTDAIEKATSVPLSINSSRARSDSRAPPSETHHKNACVSSRTLNEGAHASGPRGACNPDRTRAEDRRNSGE